MFKKKIKIKSSINYNNFDELIMFYKMLLKYKKHHPDFNLELVLFKLYPEFDYYQFRNIKF